MGRSRGRVKRRRGAGSASPAFMPAKRDAGKEKPMTSEAAEILGIRLSSPEKILYPEQGITKRALAEYYVALADWVLPHLAGRPLSLVRCPAGAKKACFFQKHVGSGVPPELRRVEIPDGVGTASHETGTSTYLCVDDAMGLVALAQMGVLEVHPWGSTVERLETPDRLIFDLDPDPAVAWRGVVDAAFRVRDALAALGLQSFVKTTGGKGLHVTVPVAPSLDWDVVKRLTRGFAERLVAEAPELFTLNMLKKQRTGRIFLDYLRNGRGATAIAPYSTRARAGATVATPLAWDELATLADPAAFTLETVPARLAGLAADPWREMRGLRQRISAGMRKELAA
jgi:bifunctional non-homologous end joining protein LigD